MFLEVPAELPPAVLARLADGPQTVRVVLEVLPAPEATNAWTRPPLRRPSRVPGPPPPADEPTRVQLELEASWTLTPADQPTVALKADPLLRPAVRHSLILTLLDYDVRLQTPRLAGQLLCRQPPVTLCADAVVRVRFAGQLGAGAVACPARQSVESNVVGEVPGPGLESKTVDVILRPNPALAARTVDVAEIWGEDVVLEGVPVRYPDTGMATSP